MVETEKNPRREFIKKLAAGTAGAGLALSMPALGHARWARGQDAPGERDIIGIMGTNGRGTALARGFARVPGAEVAYVCDVDEQAMAKAAVAVSETGAKTPKGVKDFRRILDDREVDALVIAAPDHWHAPAAILGCAAGKHIYVEKPCSHNPREGELLVAAARKYRRVVQMGNQRRSWPGVVEGIRQVREGAIGRVYYSRGWYASTRGSIGTGKVASVPTGLDYDLWQGPAPRRDYRDNILHYNWHWFWNWGTGEVGNNGVHALDLCRWGLGVDYPLRVSSAGGRYRWDDDQETPDTQVLTFDFAGEKSIMWEGLSCNGQGVMGSGFGASFHGENGTVIISGGGYTLYDSENKEVKQVTGESGAIDATGPGFSRDAVHLINFLDAIRSGERLNSGIEGGHKSTLLCHLGNIAQRTGRTLNCDPKNGRILGDRKAMKFWDREYARGWEPKV